MSIPAPPSPVTGPGQAALMDTGTAQVLLSLGKLEAAVAVITEKLNDLPDHESRLRELERTTVRADAIRLANDRAETAARRSHQAFWTAVGAVAAAVVAVAGMLEHIHH